MIKLARLEVLRTARFKSVRAARAELSHAYKPLLRDLIEFSYATLTELDEAHVKAVSFVHANIFNKIFEAQKVSSDFSILRQLNGFSNSCAKHNFLSQ